MRVCTVCHFNQHINQFSILGLSVLALTLSVVVLAPGISVQQEQKHRKAFW